MTLLVVPASPTMPSSRFAYPNAELGIVRSHTSDNNCLLVDARSLCYTMSKAARSTYFITYLASFLPSTIPSPSFFSMFCSFSRICQSVYNPATVLNISPMNQALYASFCNRLALAKARMPAVSSYSNFKRNWVEISTGGLT